MTRRGPGRPKKEHQTRVVGGRVWEEVADAVADLARLRGHHPSVEIGIAAEDLVLAGESELRRAGKWSRDLDALKTVREVLERAAG